MTYQQKIIKKLSAFIEEAGYDCVINYNWANTGIIAAVDDDFETRLSVHFNFQPDYCSFENIPKCNAHYIKYSNGSEVRRVLSQFKNALKAE